MEYANWFVVVMGIGIVFFGLIVLILAVTILGKILGKKANSNNSNGADSTLGDAAGMISGGDMSAGSRALPGEACTDTSIVAAIAAAIADDMGTDVSAIRINSIRKVA